MSLASTKGMLQDPPVVITKNSTRDMPKFPWEAKSPLIENDYLGPSHHYHSSAGQKSINDSPCFLLKKISWILPLF